MDNLTRFDELKKLNKSSNTIEELKKLLSRSKQELDSILALDILLYLAESYRVLRMHDETVSVLETEINSDFFSEKETRIKIIDDLVKTLLRTEDFIKLKSVLFNRERFLTNEHQKIMQKFYYAVCHEGLKENTQAIEYLLSIKDNISSSNLVSKYLKLSMLHLKENKIDQAEKFYDMAVKFDFKKSNPIFYLAESDIFFYKKDYLNALIKYQEYFIKSRNKRRYLDRYILINIELDRLDEAWRFYQEYLPTMKNLVSQNYRLIFYEAVRILTKKLNNISETEKLEYLIEELSPSRPLMNQFDNVYQLLSIAFNHSSYLKERDIIYKMFQAITSLYSFQKLLYIKKTEHNVMFYHYSKGLLLEKTPKITEYSETLIEDLLKTETMNELYVYDDLIEYAKSVYKTVETQYFFVNGVKREESYDYFCVYSKDLNDFDFQQKLVLIAHQIIKNEINHFDKQNKITKNIDNYKNLFKISDFGLCKIDKGSIQLLNENALRILDTKLDYLAFEEFQLGLQKKVFLDDLLYAEKIDVVYQNKALRLYISKDNLSIYLLIEELKTAEGNDLINRFLDLPNENKLIEDLKNSSSKSILLLDIRNYINYFKDYNYNAYQDLLLTYINHLKVIARMHFEALYIESFHSIYLVLKTTDKRVVSRIKESVYKLETSFDVRTSYIQINNNFDFSTLIELRYLNSLTTLEHPFIIDNKYFRYNLELAKTLVININNLIAKKEIPLHYQALGDWAKESIDILRVMISDKALLGEAASLKRVLKSANLELEWDYLIVQSLVKDLRTSSYNKKILLELSTKTVEDTKALKRIIKRLLQPSISVSSFIIKLRLDEFNDLDHLIENFELLKAHDFSICLYDFNNHFNLKDFRVFEKVNFLEIDISDTDNKYFEQFLSTLKSRDITYILNHKNKSVTKSVLEKYSITYLDGSMYPKYENVNGHL
ncbi:MAG: hypothetical protein JEZ05_06885 [Tenericutes bacterium]|nr:hypothetical protein [Mycoplasmatota bacterium]